ncbi:unnamed protein product [Cercospora beticola]|nr:unnamed protein product [Cercospora beticola]
MHGIARSVVIVYKHSRSPHSFGVVAPSTRRTAGVAGAYTRGAVSTWAAAPFGAKTLPSELFGGHGELVGVFRFQASWMGTPSADDGCCSRGAVAPSDNVAVSTR